MARPKRSSIPLMAQKVVPSVLARKTPRSCARRDRRTLWSVASTMRAVVYDRYGPPSMLRLEKVPVPVPRASEVLVEVAATSLNLSDWEALVGSPAYARFGGLRKPRRSVLGSDIAGVV